MTEQEIRAHIMLFLADLYENPISRTQWKRFAFENANDQRLALDILRRLSANLIVEQKEPGVVRLNSIGYRVVERELARLRAEQRGVPIAEKMMLVPPTHDEIREITNELGQIPDYVMASRIVEGQSEIYWATDGFQKLTGYTVEEINASGGAVMLPSHAEMGKLAELVEDLFSGRKVKGDFQIKPKRGRPLTLQFVAWPLFDAEGHVIGSLSAVRKITDGRDVQ